MSVSDLAPQSLPPPSKVEVLQGEVLSEVRQSWEGIGSLTTRLWRGRASLEVEWSVGPPPTTGAKGTTAAAAAGAGSSADWEVFVRYSSDVQSGKCLTLADGGWGVELRWLINLAGRWRAQGARSQCAVVHVHCDPLTATLIPPSKPTFPEPPSAIALLLLRGCVVHRRQWSGVAAAAAGLQTQLRIQGQQSSCKHLPHHNRWVALGGFC